MFRIFGYSRSKRFRQVQPIHQLNLHVLYPMMADLPTFGCIGQKDFDLSFLTDYERGQNIGRPCDLGILRIFNESTQKKSFIKLAIFIDKLMEKYGLTFINAVVDGINNNLSKTPLDSNSPLVRVNNKIVVFIDDPPTLEARISWMGRMVTVGLLSYGIIPLLIPWNDLLGVEGHRNILDKLSPLSPHKKSGDYNWILRKGFSLALACSNKDVIIVDTDWSKTKVLELIEESEMCGCELIFMKNHLAINRRVFVQTVIDRIKRILTRQFGVEVEPLIEHKNRVVEVVKHQNHMSMKSTASTSKDKTEQIELLETQDIKSIESINCNLKVPDSVDSLAPFSRNSWTRFLSRLFMNTASASSGSPDTSLPTNKKSVFTVPKLFRRGNADTDQLDDKSLYDFDECQQQIFNPHIIPRLTDEQFDKIFIQPKLYAKRTKVEENDLFSHSEQDLADLDSVFSNSI